MSKQTNTSSISFMGYSGYGYLITSTSTYTDSMTVSYTIGFHNNSYFWKGSDYVYGYVNATGQSQQSGSFSTNSNVSAGNHTIRTGSFNWLKGTSSASKNVTGKVTFNGSSGTTTQSFTIPVLPSYSVSYNANGGSGAPATQTKYYGKSLALSSIIPTRTNYEFLSWNTASDGTGTTYAPSSTYTVNADLTLYAQWKLSYIKPTISNLTATRTDSNGVAYDEGLYGRIKCNWTCGNTGTENIVPSSITFQYKLSTDTVYTTISTITPTTETSGTINFVTTNGIFLQDYKYNLLVTITDTIGSNSRTTYISDVFFPVDITEDGTGVAIGGVAKPNKFECNPPAQFNGSITTTGNMDIMGNCLINGVPIIDQGSNTYGNWVRLYDGTQIVWRKGTYNMTAPNTYSASGCTLYQGTTEFTFPVVFVGDAPTIGTGECHWGTSASWCAVSNINLDFVSLRLMDVAKRDASQTTRYCFIAIGRWK